VSSFNNYFGSIDRNLYSAEMKGGIDVFRRPMARYDDSKLMNIMTAKHFAQLHKDVSFNAVHPGLVWSEIFFNAPWPLDNILPTMQKLTARSSNEGAVTQVTVATHPNLKHVSGRYFEDRCIMYLCKDKCMYCDRDNSPGVVPNKLALDKETVAWLMEQSDKLVRKYE
jgi:NAD(P)-dependent dehydrogenase (short-subunit alcohol dehydrogenase family)